MTTDSLQLDIDLKGAGILNATISYAAEQPLPFRATYVGDALLDLARATVEIAGEEELYRSVLWPNEPDYWRWELTRRNGQVAVTLAYVKEQESWTKGEDERGTVRFEAHVSTRALVAAVLDALDDVLRTFGAAEFDVDWDPRQVGVPRHFPYIEYVRLREMFLRIDPHSQEFADMIRAVLAQLHVDEHVHPWRIVPPLENAAEPNIGALVEDVSLVYVPVSALDEAAVAFADRVQDDLIDIYRRAVPECLPGHPHPPKADLVDGHAAWLCPRTGQVVRQMIGEQDGGN